MAPSKAAAAYQRLPSGLRHATVGPHGLTPRQAAVLRFIGEHIAARQRPPAMREVCEAFGISSPNGVYAILRALVRRGCLRFAPTDSDSPGYTRIEVVGLAELIGPLVREHVAALIGEETK
jgi:hypothetical protein